MSPPFVTVLITAYNHERYIAQALDSVLMQQVAFPIEVVIIDDCSTDGTADIVRQFQRQHPDVIRPIFEETNQNSNRTWGRAILSSRSRYIALLDGDDYWLAPEKLQTQVDFLESHPGVVLSFHDAYNLYPDGRRVRYSHDVSFALTREIYSLDDLRSQNFVPTCSAMFRAGVLERFPDTFEAALAADWYLHVLHAQHGAIGYLDQVWGVRRVHEGGLISTRSDYEILELRIASIERMNEALSFKYSRSVLENLIRYAESLKRWDQEQGRTWRARKRSAAIWWRRMSIRHPALYRAEACCRQGVAFARRRPRTTTFSS